MTTDLSTLYAELRLLRQELSAVRQQMLQNLDAIDDRLVAMAPDLPSFQIPRSYKGYLARHAHRAGGGKHD